MSATQTATPEPAQPDVFVMPVPHNGQCVMYYMHGVVSRTTGTIGYVVLVGRANIELHVHGFLKESVCHVDDPVLKENLHARKSGVWDFCPRDKEIDQKMATLQARIDQIESACTKHAK